MSTHKKLAQTFRDQHNLQGKGGVVTLFAGEAFGWQNALRGPHTVVPGAIAIDEDGNEWLAVGGNNYDGATDWQPIKNTETAS